MNRDELLIQSSEWWSGQADELIKRYKACKTVHEQNKLRPKLEQMQARLGYEKKLLSQAIGI